MIKSDGGSSSYYTFQLDDGSYMETEEIIRCMVGGSFDLGNIVKCVRRIQAHRDGEGKEGTDILYDLRKIKYTVEKLIKLEENNIDW